MRAMRTFLSFLLALMLSLNAAYVAAVGACGPQEHESSHAAHFGHHSHGDDHAHDVQPVSADEAGKVSAISDHQHNPVHPSFSSILPHTLDITPMPGSSPLVAALPGTFISASPTPAKRPPRASRT
jgi:hypothetical protein